MQHQITVSRIEGEGLAHIFAVAVDDYEYKVSVSEDYYQQLTGGKISPEALIRKSFDFLLEREGPESILKQFALPQIQHYFPEYEATMQQTLAE